MGSGMATGAGAGGAATNSGAGGTAAASMSGAAVSAGAGATVAASTASGMISGLVASCWTMSRHGTPGLVAGSAETTELMASTPNHIPAVATDVLASLLAVDGINFLIRPATSDVGNLSRLGAQIHRRSEPKPIRCEPVPVP